MSKMAFDAVCHTSLGSNPATLASLAGGKALLWLLLTSLTRRTHIKTTRREVTLRTLLLPDSIPSAATLDDYGGVACLHTGAQGSS